MRILVFLHSFEPGGVERVALRLAGAWAEAGQDVRILMGRDTGPQGGIAPNDVRFEFAPHSRLAEPFETFWLAWHVIRAIRRERPDVIFCAGSTYVIIAAILRLFLRSDCPPIVGKLSNSLERRDLAWPARAFVQIWLRMHRHILDQIVGMAAPMRREIEDCIGIAANRVAVIPDPALNADELRVLSSRSSRRRTGRRFIAVGRLTRQKNFPLLIRAFSLIAETDDRLVILGEGSQRKGLEWLSHRLGVGDQVELPGHVNSVPEVLATADVFVSSSNYEGLPSVVVEALAAGLPIVATDCSACMDYLLGYGDFGRLVPIRDYQALADAMSEAANPNDLTVRAMRCMAAEFTVERSAGLYVGVFAATVLALTRRLSIRASAATKSV